MLYGTCRGHPNLSSKVGLANPVPAAPRGRERCIKETATTYAEVALTRLQQQVDSNQHPSPRSASPEAIEQWLEVAELQEPTRDRYEDLIRLYIARCRSRPRYRAPSSRG
jgi:hypothetical protein